MAAVSFQDIPGTELQLNEFLESIRSNVFRTQFESGPPRQSRLFDGIIRIRDMVYIMTKEGFDEFSTTWFSSINDGADLFDWFDPNTQALVEVRMVNGIYEARPLSQNLTHYEVRFTVEQFEGNWT
jgi:hypothetical protein